MPKFKALFVLLTIISVHAIASSFNINHGNSSENLNVNSRTKSFQAKATPTFSIVSPTTGAQGSSINLVASKGGSTGQVTYTVANGTGKASVSSQILLLLLRGSVTLTATLAEDANFLGATVTQEIIITNPQAPIAFTTLSGDAGKSVSLSLDKGGSTGTVSLSIENLSGSASLNDNTLSLTNPGTILVKASITADNNYDANAIAQVFTINNSDGTKASVLAKIYGTTTKGGDKNAGVLYETNSNFSGITLLKQFGVETSGASPIYSQMLLAQDGKLYGMNNTGGQYNAGVMFTYEPATDTYTVVHQFNPATGASGMGKLFQAANGMMYGLGNAGGANDAGVVFSFDPATSTYTKKADLELVSTGGLPLSGFLEGSPGMLYAVVNAGGANGNMGTLIRYDIANNILSKRYDFSTTTGFLPVGALVKAANGKMYGLMSQGGPTNSGTIVEIDPSNDIVVTRKMEFDYQTTGTLPLGSFVEASNGKLYATTAYGGTTYNGTLIEYVPGATTVAVKHNFDTSIGGSPFASMVEAPNGKLYGFTPFGGSTGNGSVFEYDPANGFTNKIQLQKSVGSLTISSFTIFTNGKLYATSASGGAYNSGTLMEYDVSTNTLINKEDFIFSLEGAYPTGNLVANNGKLYGATNGGSFNLGTLFQYDLSGAVYNKIIDFVGSNGAIVGNLIKHPDGKIYVLTRGGSTGGRILRFDPATGNSSTVYTFDNSNDGLGPQNMMLASNGKLYGVTISGGQASNGVIFEFDPSSNTYTKKFDVDNPTTGAGPSRLTEGPDGKLYCTMAFGGTAYVGTIFSFDLATGTDTHMSPFDLATTGSGPRGNVTFSGGKLYGLAQAGGANNKGTLFEMDLASGTISKKLDLNNYVYDQGLVTGPNGKLLGFFADGGTAKKGSLFEYDPSANSLNNVLEFNGTNGANPAGDLLVNRNRQLITFNQPPAASASATTVTLNASASSELPISFVSSDPTVATVSGNVATILKSGSVLITAMQQGDGMYEPAPRVSRILTIKKSQSISFDAIAEKIFGAAAFSVTATATSNLPVSFSSSNTSVATVSGNTITIIGAGTTNITANQIGDVEFDAAPGVPKSLVVTKAPQTITFPNIEDKVLGAASFSITATSTSNLAVSFSSASDKVSISTASVTLLKAGRAAIKADQAGNTNFNAATTVEKSFCINPAKPTISMTTDPLGVSTLVSSNDSGNQWYREGTAIENATAKNITATTAGSYTVKTTIDGCSSVVSDAKLVVITGLETNSGERNMRVYPNVFDRNVFIEISSDVDEAVTIEFTDMLGKSHARIMGRTNSVNDAEIDVAPGFYFVRSKTSSGIYTQRVLKK
jgi:uncharacterized repeat protein (TIGR03803 family)